MLSDSNQEVKALATKRLGGKAKAEHRGRPLISTNKTPVDSKPTRVSFVKDFKPASGRKYELATLKEGIPVYTDRAYRITSVPEKLSGSTFIRTANSDAERNDTQPALEFYLNTPATLYLADDARAEHLPLWARKHWKLTDLTIETTDPKVMRIYKKHWG